MLLLFLTTPAVMTLAQVTGLGINPSPSLRCKGRVRKVAASSNCCVAGELAALDLPLLLPSAKVNAKAHLVIAGSTRREGDTLLPTTLVSL